MKENTSETNYPCFLSVISAQEFFNNSTKGINEKTSNESQLPA
jgi:hypothetical protein